MVAGLSTVRVKFSVVNKVKGSVTVIEIVAEPRLLPSGLRVMV